MRQGGGTILNGMRASAPSHVTGGPIVYLSLFTGKGTLHVPLRPTHAEPCNAKAYCTEDGRGEGGESGESTMEGV